MAQKSDHTDLIKKQTRRDFLRIGTAAMALFGGLYPSFTESAEDNTLYALRLASQAVRNWCKEQTALVSENLIFAPHCDYTHFNLSGSWNNVRELQTMFRVDIGRSSLYDLETEKKEAQTLSQPVIEDVSSLERSLVALSNFLGRREINGKVLVAKHFPGGPAIIETTEKNQVFVQDDCAAFEKHLQPFQRVLPLAEALMVCHASYPKLEDNLSLSHSEYDRLIQAEIGYLGFSNSAYDLWKKKRPATLSPTIIRGLTKKLGFKGIVVSDAMNMGAIVKSGETLLSLSGKNISEKGQYTATLTNLFALYSGINYFLLGSKGNLEFIYAHAKDAPYFRSCVEQSYIKYQRLHGLIGKDMPQASTIEDKIESLLTNKSIGDSWTDVWDGSGYLHQLFRRRFLASFYGDEKYFTDRLEFEKAQKAFDWDSLTFGYETVLKELSSGA